MKPTGHVRKVDELGRVVIPIDVRRELNIEPQMPIDILVEGDGIIFAKYEDKCVFCGGVRDVHLFKEKPVCNTCKSELLDELNKYLRNMSVDA